MGDKKTIEDLAKSIHNVSKSYDVVIDPMMSSTPKTTYGKSIVEKLSEMAAALDPEQVEWVDNYQKGLTVKVMGMRLPGTPKSVAFMRAKFAGVCPCCGETFPRTIPIAWAKGAGAKHIACWYRSEPTTDEAKPMMQALALEADRVLSELLWMHGEAIGEGNLCLDLNSPAPDRHLWACMHQTAPWNKLMED